MCEKEHIGFVFLMLGYIFVSGPMSPLFFFFFVVITTIPY